MGGKLIAIHSINRYGNFSGISSSINEGLSRFELDHTAFPGFLELSYLREKLCFKPGLAKLLKITTLQSPLQHLDREVISFSLPRYCSLFLSLPLSFTLSFFGSLFLPFHLSFSIYLSIFFCITVSLTFLLIPSSLFSLFFTQSLSLSFHLSFSPYLSIFFCISIFLSLCLAHFLILFLFLILSLSFLSFFPSLFPYEHFQPSHSPSIKFLSLFHYIIITNQPAENNIKFSIKFVVYFRLVTL